MRAMSGPPTIGPMTTEELERAERSFPGIDFLATRVQTRIAHALVWIELATIEAGLRPGLRRAVERDLEDAAAFLLEALKLTAPSALLAASTEALRDRGEELARFLKAFIEPPEVEG